MTDESFASQLTEMYQGEVIGEVLFDRLLETCSDPAQRYKVATMLQLETETKARLRPALLELGADITEQAESRRLGGEFADSLAGQDWAGMMTTLRDTIRPYLERYETIAAGAPDAWRPLAESMVVHEAALYEFAEKELAGDTQSSVEAIVAQLEFPLPAPD